MPNYVGVVSLIECLNHREFPDFWCCCARSLCDQSLQVIKGRPCSEWMMSRGQQPGRSFGVKVVEKVIKDVLDAFLHNVTYDSFR